MLEKIELRLPDLIYLYNLLVPEIQTFLDADQPGPELATLLDQTNAALERLSGEAVWFVCVKEGCDGRPFRLTASELADDASEYPEGYAEGVISCDVCGRLCHRVLEETLQRTFLP